MEDLLQTIAEIAAAFAGFASVVVIFRRRGDIDSDTETKVTFQSMLLGSLFVVFFALLPQVLQYALPSTQNAYQYPAALLLLYIVLTFAWGITRDGGRVRAGLLVYLTAALTIASSQTAGLLGFAPIAPSYLIGVFALLVISGYAFYSLITFTEVTRDDT